MDLPLGILIGFIITATSFAAGRLGRKHVRFIVCPRCKGTGKSGTTVVGYNKNTESLEARREPCSLCEGTGILWEPEPNHFD